MDEYYNISYKPSFPTFKLSPYSLDATTERQKDKRNYDSNKNR